VTFFFPRAESQVYAEPKRLVAAGLAEARAEPTGRRPRTVYSITPAGREALAEWLATPPASRFQFEFEVLLRVMLAPFGRDEDLVQAFGKAKGDAAGLVDLAHAIRAEYLDGRAPFQRHIVWRAFLLDFLMEFGEAMEDWAERSLDRVRAWEGETEEERRAAARAIIEQAGRRRPR
jgi:DNA-binding PadR family transcriptional regulator